ncbi:MAG: hypothetical protein ACE5JQ_12170 [Candidatus Methylomirabilales bacterium]
MGYGDGRLQHFRRQSLQELGIRVQRRGPAEGDPQLSGLLVDALSAEDGVASLTL